NSNTLTGVLSLRDAQSNPIAGVTPAFFVSGTNTTVGPSGSTSANGEASVTYQSSLAQNENAVVTAAGITLAAPMAFVAGPATGAASTLTANPNIIAGDGTGSISLVATARDAQGNAATGVSVTFGASGGNTTFGSAGGYTASNGAYTTTVTSTQMQTETITARIAGNFNETVSVTFTGSPDPTASTLVVNPNSTTVGPSNAINANLTLRDAMSNPLAGVATTWSGTGSTNTIISSGITSSTGVATATYSSTLAQNENVQVAAGGINLYQPIKFTAGSPNATMSYLYATPTRQLANNSNIITARLVLRDTYNNAVSGQSVSFSASGSQTIVAGTPTTSGSGQAAGTYRTGTIQNQNAVVTGSNFMFFTPMIFTDIPAQCVLLVNPNNQTADGASSLNLTATVTNNSNQPVPGIQVIFSSTGAAQLFSPQNVITTASGQASTSLRSPYAGSNTILAQAANVQCAGQGNFLTRAPPCTGNPNFKAASYSLGGSPLGVTTGDFDGDGKRDVAIAGISLNIFMNIGGGMFQAQGNYGAGSSPASVTTGDFNGDAKQDLAVVNYVSNNLGIFFGTGTGTFQAQVAYAAGSNPQDLTLGDFNGDGRQDLAVVNSGSNTLGVFLNTGVGTFQTQVTYGAGSSPVAITVGDFNGDGKQDLAVVNYSSNNLGVFLGTGTGQFQPQVTYATGSSPFDITAGDFDGDGKQDLAVLNR
ncbi:MAG: hypothetical protein EOO38_09265, partial [Cytophagaceae bacterium]